MTSGFRSPIPSRTKLIGGGVILLILAVLFAIIVYKAYDAGVSKADTEISQYQKKIEELNRKQREKEIIVRERIITQYHTREIVRTKVEYKNRDVIRTVVPEQFKLSKGWIYAHDQSATGQEIDPALASDPTPSEVSDNVALLTITDNYNIANRNADRLEALQNYIREVGIPITNDPQNTNRPK